MDGCFGKRWRVQNRIWQLMEIFIKTWWNANQGNDAKLVTCRESGFAQISSKPHELHHSKHTTKCVKLHGGHILYWHVSLDSFPWVSCVICSVLFGVNKSFPETICFNNLCCYFRNKSWVISHILSLSIYPTWHETVTAITLNISICSPSLGYIHQWI